MLHEVGLVKSVKDRQRRALRRRHEVTAAEVSIDFVGLGTPDAILNETGLVERVKDRQRLASGRRHEVATLEGSMGPAGLGTSHSVARRSRRVIITDE